MHLSPTLDLVALLQSLAWQMQKSNPNYANRSIEQNPYWVQARGLIDDMDGNDS